MIEYALYSSADEDAMTRVLADVFALQDPPAVAVGLLPSEFARFVRLLCPGAGAQQLTVIARSSKTGEVVGALVAEDSASELPAGMELLSPKFGPIFDILGQLDAEHRAGRTVARGESVHLFLLGVDSRFAGQGIAHGLLRACLANAASRGYRHAVTEATNRTSQHVFRKQGFVERVRRSYRDHRFEGRSPFTGIADHGGPILMTKELSPPRD
jgi:ribosomal protein S18 acetylase RimI-like enzyme